MSNDCNTARHLEMMVILSISWAVPMTHQGCGFLPFTIGLHFTGGPSRNVNSCYMDTLGLNSCWLWDLNPLIWTVPSWSYFVKQ